MQVREMMSSPAVTVTPETKIPEIARLMREKQISGLPVVDGTSKLLGLITELDLIERNAPLKEPRYLAVLAGLIPVSLDEYSDYREQVRHVLATNAQEIMSKPAHIVTPATDMETVMRLMMDPTNTLLPVVENEQVIGVITRTDLVRVIEQLEMAVEEDGQGK
ncbi:MAG: CBS domain-containing protein [Caldilineaceae bacterium]